VKYLNEAKAGGSSLGDAGSFSWDDKQVGAQTLLGK
jgi:hypothetical protein